MDKQQLIDLAILLGFSAWFWLIIELDYRNTQKKNNKGKATK